MVDKVVNKVVDKAVDKAAEKRMVMSEPMHKILLEIRNNPNVTQSQLVSLTGIGKTMVQKYISELKKERTIERVGSNKTGYWKILN